MAASGSADAMAGGMSHGEPAAKRKRSTESVASGLTAAVVSQHDRDIQFIVTHLKEGPAQLAQYIAGLLRDGVFQMSMKDASAVPSHVALGKKLPGKLRKLQHLPPRAKIVFICTVVESLNGLLEVKDMGKKEKGDGKETKGKGKSEAEKAKEKETRCCYCDKRGHRESQCR